MQDYANDNKTTHEHNVTPMSSSESQEDKTAQRLDDVVSTPGESLDDLEVDKILSNSKVDQQNSEHRFNLTVRIHFTTLVWDAYLFKVFVE